jgi:hypothetical protein
MATGPAEAKEAVRIARSANVNGAIGKKEQGEVLKLSTTRSFAGIGAPGSGRNRDLRDGKHVPSFIAADIQDNVLGHNTTRHNRNEENKRGRGKRQTTGEYGDGDSHNGHRGKVTEVAE